MANMNAIARALLDPAITTVFVGAERRKFSIHRALLLQRSEYIRSAYNSQMKEALEDTFVFIDIDSDTFQTFTLWLYTNEILLGAGLEPLAELPGADGEAEEDDESATSFDADHRDDTTLSEGWYEDLGDEEEGGEEAAENFGEDMISESLTEKEWFRAIHDPNHHFAGDPEQLSSYQLRTLLMLHEKNDSYDAERVQWKALLAEKASTSDDDEAIITTALIDLYILADRFGVRELSSDDNGPPPTSPRAMLRSIGQRGTLRARLSRVRQLATIITTPHMACTSLCLQLESTRR